jgi:ornithine carbamoyltransferase
MLLKRSAGVIFNDAFLRHRPNLHEIIELAKNLKNQLKEGSAQQPLPDKQLVMIFEKHSTRTRVSFEVGINQLGGNAIILNAENSQIGRGESIHDTARVLSRYADIIMIRCFSHDTLLELAKHSDVPVINGLTDYSHPCQIMADIMTFEEHFGTIIGKKIAWIGDGNNMTNSWIHASARFGFELSIATPKQYRPEQKLIDWANTNGGNVTWSDNPVNAAQNADAINTDTWVSMGSTDANERMALLQNFQVNTNLMSLANKDAIFMHCLPAHRGEEVTNEVIDGRQSVIFDEAENRLHVQKAIMIWCMRDNI